MIWGVAISELNKDKIGLNQSGYSYSRKKSFYGTVQNWGFLKIVF